MRLREAYAKAFDCVMVFALGLTCLGFLVACGMRWYNVRVVAKRREGERGRQGGREGG